MTWIEEQPGVHYVFGLARSKRLETLLQPTFQELHASHAAVGEAARSEGREEPHAARAFSEFQYQTQKSWSRARRVIGKAGILGEKENPRFIVTDPAGNEEWAAGPPSPTTAKALCEKFYRARGDMEPSGARWTGAKRRARRVAAEAAIKTGSRNNNLTFWPTAPPPRRWQATSRACGFPPSPTC